MSIGPMEKKASVCTAYCCTDENAAEQEQEENRRNNASPIEMIMIAVSPVRRACAADARDPDRSR